MLAVVPLRNAILQGSNQRTKSWANFLSKISKNKKNVQPKMCCGEVIKEIPAKGLLKEKIELLNNRIKPLLFEN